MKGNIYILLTHKAWANRKAYTCFSEKKSLNIIKIQIHLKRILKLFVSSGQLLSGVRLFATPWTAVHQASLSITNSQRLLKLVSIKLVMPSNHLILWNYL